MANNFYRKSQCRNSYLHRFEIKAEYPEGVKEVCIICGMSKFFRVIDGKLNNLAYMDWHVRNALPNIHPLFTREFPEHALTPSPYV